MPLESVLAQKIPSAEIRAVIAAAAVSDNPVRVHRADLEELSRWAKPIADGSVLPVGSVEFIHESLRVARVQHTPIDCYPQALHPFLHRHVRRCRAGNVLGRHFVKPVQTKQFDGFVFDTMDNPDLLDAHTAEQHAAFMAIDADDPVWLSEVVSFVSEYRYYVQAGAIIGMARYDQKEGPAPGPDRAVVEAMIQSFACPHPYALDVGVLQTGETALVEVNDAYAIGLYSACLTPKAYLRFLDERWRTLIGPAQS